jgi:ATP-dependent DNA helicase RecG
MNATLSSSVQYLKGIGPQRAEQLQKIGLNTLEDVLFYFPRRYQDRSEILSISKVEPGTVATICGTITSLDGRPGFRRGSVSIFKASVSDETGRIAVVWFNQPYLRKYFNKGDRVLLHGRIELYKDKLQIVSPEFELLDTEEEAPEIDKIAPIYTLPQGFSQKMYRKMVKAILEKYLPSLTEVLPFDIRNRHKLLNIAKSLLNIHFPQTHDFQRAAYERLSFEEFFLYQMPLVLRKLKRREKQGIAFEINEAFLDKFIATLPFSLTEDQQTAIDEIKADMRLPGPMQRLLQGDVGSGKTIVATIAGLIAVNNSYQAAFMAPTEILARQHYEKLKTGLSIFRQKTENKAQKTEIKVGLLTSSLSVKEKREISEKIKKGELDIIIGTHAFLEEGVKFHKLGLIVIDEQHKFGVSQRALLPRKGANPDILIMTATPIPRTLAITLYGDTDISFIRQLPKGRKKINTALYGLSERRRAYDFVKVQIRQGRQAYIVYPLIEENPRLALSSAKSMYKEFCQDIFKEFRLGLIHGKLDRHEQEEVMKQFRSGALDILIATTILEVGIDVPNVNVILIEHAERFGLSQLHQMRGRIGRGEHESFCIFLADPNTEEAQARLNVLVTQLDGFRIAEEDLKIRGPGEFFGERQSGLTELKIANPLTQMHLLKSAREEVVRLLNNDPKLEARQNQELKKQLHKRFPEFERFVEVG